MKKFLITILAFVYLASSVGATVHMHYCMDKLIDWGLGANKSEKCSNCGMEKTNAKDNGCCKDEHKQVKLENDQKAAESYKMMHVNLVASPVTFFELPAICLPSVTEENPLSHVPPRSSGIAAYIRNCVFRI